MKKYLLPEKGNFYKANLHCHSNKSDGQLSVEELVKLYKSNGYSVLGISDHEVLMDNSMLDDENFITVTCYEYELANGLYSMYEPLLHMCLYAKDQHNVKQICYDPSKMYPSEVNFDLIPSIEYAGEYFSKKLDIETLNYVIKTAKENGFLVSYNHHSWNNINDEFLLDTDGFFAVELLNGSANKMGYGDNSRFYDYLLRNGKRIACLGGDDNHNEYPEGHPRFDSFGAFTMIKAEKLQYKNIMDALENGNCYSSEGPEIYSLYSEDNKVYITCSDVSKIYMYTGGRHHGILIANENESVSSACFELKDDDEFVRFEIIDKYGRKAFTRGYFMDEVK